MSFRQYGGINYAARNNIVKSNYTNANNLSVMTKVGQPSSVINFESDISGNTIYGPYDFIGDVSITGNLSVSGTTSLNGNTDAYQIHLTGDSSTYQDNNSVVPKSYVDNVSAGIRPTVPCQLATTTFIPSLSGLIEIDGILTQPKYRVLVNNQANTSPNTSSIANGIYVVPETGTDPWTRALDCSGNNVQGQSTFIQLGATNAKKTFVQTATNGNSTAPVIAGTNALLYVEYNSLNLTLGPGLAFTNSNTVIQVKSDLSSPAFITSLTVDCSNDTQNNKGIYTINDTSALRLVSAGGKNYIESGTSIANSAADLCFSNMNSTAPLMTIYSDGNVGIGTTSNSGKKLDVNGTLNISGDTTLGGGLTVSGVTTLIGSSTAQTPLIGTNDGQIATTSFVQSAVTVVTIVYTTNQTIYLKTCKRLTITCIGGGGGSGVSSTSSYGGAGGSGAAVFFEIVGILTTTGLTLTLTVGSGGAPGSPGTSSVVKFPSYPSSTSNIAVGYSMTAGGGGGGTSSAGGSAGLASGTYLYKVDGVKGVLSGLANSQPISTQLNGGYGYGAMGRAYGNSGFYGGSGCVILTYYY